MLYFYELVGFLGIGRFFIGDKVLGGREGSREVWIWWFVLLEIWVVCVSRGIMIWFMGC